MARYPNISDHGLIGDLQTAALVTTDGVLDWFCCPRFDSPSVFASLLDANCKAHELDNLYVVDTSFFPSIGAVNPALTAMANALRVADHISDRIAS